MESNNNINKEIIFISGPVSYKLLKPNNNSDPYIILFGDEHFSNKNTCSNCNLQNNICLNTFFDKNQIYNTFLKHFNNISYNIKLSIDLFMEASVYNNNFNSKIKISDNSLIPNLREKIINCYSKDSKYINNIENQCIYKYIRYHASDFRIIENSIEKLFIFLDNYDIKNNNTYLQFNQYLKIIEFFLYYILNKKFIINNNYSIIKNNVFLYLMNHYRENSFIKKQISKQKNKYYINKINNYISYHLDNIYIKCNDLEINIIDKKYYIMFYNLIYTLNKKIKKYNDLDNINKDQDKNNIFLNISIKYETNIFLQNIKDLKELYEFDIILLQIDTLILDIYYILRNNKKIEKKNNNINFNVFDGVNTNNNIILSIGIFGSNHVNNITHFYTKISNKYTLIENKDYQIHNKNSDPRRCINLNEIKNKNNDIEFNKLYEYLLSHYIDNKDYFDNNNNIINNNNNMINNNNNMINNNINMINNIEEKKIGGSKFNLSYKNKYEMMKYKYLKLKSLKNKYY